MKEYFCLNKLNSEKGITLVVLAVTVIILIILSGISLTMVNQGSNNIITKAQNTTTNATDKSVASAVMAIETPYNSIDDFVKYLQNNGFLKEGPTKDINNNQVGVLNISKLLNSNTERKRKWFR